MIKLILGLIAVLMVLIAYTFTQSEEKVEDKVIKKIKTKVTKKQKVKQPKVKEYVSVKGNIIDEVIALQKSVTMSDSVESTDDIGEGLTLEDIESADVSDEEKERMRDDLVYYQAKHTEASEPVSEEEILKIIIEDTKNGN